MVGQGPNYPDHDTQRSGSLINPEGYMLLESYNKDLENDEGESSESDVNHSDDEILPENLDNSAHIMNEYDSRNATVENIDCFPDLFTDAGDKIGQFDGADDSSSDDEFDVNFMKNTHPAKMRRLVLESSESEDNSDDISVSVEPHILNVEENGEQFSGHDTDSPANVSLEIPSDKVVIKDGREHVWYPNTGRSYIFHKSHRAKPSSISRHCNDILNIAQVEKSLQEKPNLLLLLDDGADFGGRGLQTLFYFGDLFMRLNLDVLLVTRNAPGDSKWNPIER